MKSKTIVSFLVLFASLLQVRGQGADGAEEAQFRKVEIPSNESRLSELARIREFRCTYELPKYSYGNLLIAEHYRDGKRIKAFRLAYAVNGDPKAKDSGVISIGWHRDFKNLIAVQSNGYLSHSPWTGMAHVEGFAPLDAFHFEKSLPETREPEREGGHRFQLYPVIGLCGERRVKIDYSEVKDSQSFLDACSRSRAKEALIVYLYFSSAGEDPSMLFEKGSQ